MPRHLNRVTILGVGIILIVGIGGMVRQPAQDRQCKLAENPTPSKGLLGYYPPPPSPPSLLDKIMDRVILCPREPVKEPSGKPADNRLHSGNGPPRFSPPE